MELNIKGYSYCFSYIKNNIMRCTITKGLPVKNVSLLVENAVFKQQDGTDPLVSAETDKDTVIWKSGVRELFRMTRCSLETIPVVKYFMQ